MSLGVFTTNGSGTDVLDRVVHRCQGEPLRLDRVGDGGETDDISDGRITSRDAHRLRAAGLVSNRAGLRPDQLAHVAGWDDTPDAFVAWYFDQCLAGLAQRAEQRQGTPWHERTEPDPDDAVETCTVGDIPADAVLPTILVDYLGRLVFGDKATYAAEYAYHVVHGAPAPSDPGTEWAGKARRRVEALARKAGGAS